ncbi:helix-turn-helix transcriptional regulator [Exilibacterium tricleocarpae]|uniref:Helix-turn-helix transcriptional regulator n=1 Tax=Exilibacterium tricleocarpae TaxID=2591008 RepID=A0A545UBI9_9GAMM|nr:AraC family transcriptional regulator [Exilibacterium tricleocarpae]TQV86793.1 helix-turn-helix transcriptional regulator [Exilibacterium tricleocarpae]
MDDYLAFYRRVYGVYLREARLLEGKDTIGMFLTQQPEGCFPDEATSTYNLQLNIGSPVLASADLGVGKREMPMPRGGFVIVPPETKADYDVYLDHRIMGLGIPTSYFDNAATDLGLSGPSIESLLSDAHTDAIVKQVVKECWAEANRRLLRGSLFIDANLMILTSRILSLAAGRRSRAKTVKPALLSDRHYDLICQYVDSNIETNLRMKSLARLVDMSEHSFSRAFKARTGRSPYQWVIDRRLTRAEMLLRKSKMSLAEIAFAAGFSSQAHMTTLFSQRMGTTPAEFRLVLS